MRKKLRLLKRKVLRPRRVLFSWRLKYAFVGAGLLSLLATTRPAQALNISSAYFSPTEVTCELGCAPGVATFNYTIDTPGQITLDIYRVVNTNEQGTKIKSIVFNVTTSGAKSYDWDALWLINGETGRQSGSYVFDVTLSTTAGSTSVRASNQVKLNSIDIHNINISPSFDASGQPTFPYSFNFGLAKAANVTVKILNSTGTVVRTLLDNKLLQAETVSVSTITWDGLDQSGKPVPLAIYTVTFDATDPAVTGSTAIQRTRSLAVTSLAGSATDPQKTFEDNVYVYPNPIRSDQAFFHYAAVREGATITLKIYTINGDLVRSETFAGVATGNVQIYTWDVANQSGRRLGRGLYYYVMREEDNQGTLQITKKMAVIR